jgi:hypothetical protein
MERDNQRNRGEELYFFSSSESENEWIPPAPGETLNLAKYSLKNAFKEVIGISNRK